MWIWIFLINSFRQLNPRTINNSRFPLNSHFYLPYDKDSRKYEKHENLEENKRKFQKTDPEKTFSQKRTKKSNSREILVGSLVETEKWLHVK